jgi:hypothetical protein
MQSGNLVINSRTKARCSDGSRYPTAGNRLQAK